MNGVAPPVDTSLSPKRVISTLKRVIETKGVPQLFRTENGTVRPATAVYIQKIRVMVPREKIAAHYIQPENPAA